VVIAVVATRAMQMSADEVVNMIVVGNSFVPAVGAVRVSAVMAVALVLGCAGAFVLRALGQAVFVDMIGMHVMKMSFVQVVGVIIVLHRFVTTIGTMCMFVRTMCFAAAHQ